MTYKRNFANFLSSSQPVFFLILILLAPPVPAHMAQMNGLLSGFSRVWWHADHLNQVCWSRETSKICRVEGPTGLGLKNIAVTVAIKLPDRASSWWIFWLMHSHWLTRLTGTCNGKESSLLLLDTPVLFPALTSQNVCREEDYKGRNAPNKNIFIMTKT